MGRLPPEGRLPGNVLITLPTSSTDNALVRFDGTTGDAIQNSGVIIDDSNNVFLPDDAYIMFGNTTGTPDIRIGWNTAQTVDALYIGTLAAQNTIIIAENADRTFDFAHAAQTNPTLFVHSAAQSTSQWISLTHDGSNGLIEVGTGSIVMTDNFVITGSARMG